MRPRSSRSVYLQSPQTASPLSSQLQEQLCELVQLLSAFFVPHVTLQPPTFTMNDCDGTFDGDISPASNVDVSPAVAGTMESAIRKMPISILRICASLVVRNLGLHNTKSASIQYLAAQRSSRFSNGATLKFKRDHYGSKGASTPRPELFQNTGRYSRWPLMPNVRFGSKADKPSRAEINFCPLLLQ